MTCGPSGLGAMTSPCRGTCGDFAPTRRVVLADRIDASTRMALGQQVQARLDGVPDRDNKGRIAHLVGFELRGSFRVTLAGTNDAVSSVDLLAVNEHFFLENAGGWQYLTDVDGRDLHNDVWMRNLRSAVALPTAIGANQGAGAVDTTIRQYFPFTRLDAFAPSLRGAIPLASIKARGRSAFRWQVASALPGTPAGITVNGWQGTVDLFLHVVYLPSVWVDSGWQLENYTLTDRSGMLRHADRFHEYISIMPRSEDGADLSAYSGVTFQVSGDQLIGSLSAAEMVERNAALLATDLDSASTELPLTDSQGAELSYFAIPRSKTTKSMGAGPVTFNYATRTDSFTRYLHRTVPCHMPQIGQANLKAAMDCNPQEARGIQVDEVTGGQTDGTDPAAPIIVTRASSNPFNR